MSAMMDGSGIAATTVSLDVITFSHASSSITFPATCSLSIRSRDGTDRIVAKKFTIAAEATWERVDLEFDADASAVINNDNGQGLQVAIVPDMGSNHAVGAEGTWENASGAYGVGDADMWADFAGNYVGFTNIDVHRGSPRPFLAISYDEDLTACQRYIEKITSLAGADFLAVGISSTATRSSFIFHYKTRKRATPVTE